MRPFKCIYCELKTNRQSSECVAFEQQKGRVSITGLESMWACYFLRQLIVRGGSLPCTHCCCWLNLMFTFEARVIIELAFTAEPHYFKALMYNAWQKFSQEDSFLYAYFIVMGSFVILRSISRSWVLIWVNLMADGGGVRVACCCKCNSFCWDHDGQWMMTLNEKLFLSWLPISCHFSARSVEPTSAQIQRVQLWVDPMNFA